MREITFLLNHKDAFTNHICGFYALSESFIERYRNYLNWDFISLNEKLPWSVSYIEKFQDSWNWATLGENESLPWSDELIIKFADKWSTNENQSGWCLTNNSSIKWSKNIITRFPEKFSGDWLAQNTDLLNNHPELLDEFKESLWWDYISGNEYMIWSEVLIDRFITFWNWEILSANEAISWTPELKEKYSEHFNPKSFRNGYYERWINKKNTKSLFNNVFTDGDKTPYTPEELVKRIKLNYPGRLSSDVRVPWSIEILEKYENEWDWESLSTNRKLPWSVELINKYLEKWDFGTKFKNDDDGICHSIGLTLNSGLPWSLELIKTYESRWDWEMLTYSEYIPWSLELLVEFENKWDWDRIIWNETMWQKVFYPSLDEEFIGALLTIMNKKIYPF